MPFFFGRQVSVRVIQTGDTFLLPGMLEYAQIWKIRRSAMKIIKGLLLSLLSLLLFFSLSLFGIALTLRSTVLNPEFVTAEVNKLNIPVAVREVVDQTIILPPEYAAFKEPVHAILVALAL